jgi:hypothetical protein
MGAKAKKRAIGLEKAPASVYLSSTLMRRRTPAISQDVGQCAVAMRRAIERAPLGRYDAIMHSFPHSCCKVASQMLARYLATHARVPLVQFVSGRRHGEPYCSGGWQAHVWVEAGGVVIDITADQYDEMTHPVIAMPSSDWHETFQVRSRIPYGEMMQMDGSYARRFERMYREVTARMDASTSKPARSRSTVRAGLANGNGNGPYKVQGQAQSFTVRARPAGSFSRPGAAEPTAAPSLIKPVPTPAPEASIKGTKIPARVGAYSRPPQRGQAPGNNGVGASLRKVLSFFGREPNLVEPGS